MAMQKQPLIAVCGAGTCEEPLAAIAEEVGQQIAATGAVLVCGGLGGVMEAACRGATEAGGMTLGILPGDDPQSANPYVQIAIPTGMGHARNVIIVQTADIVIAIGGAYGTLSEIALARKCGRHVIGLHTWPLGQDDTGMSHVIPAENPTEAVEQALQELRN